MNLIFSVQILHVFPQFFLCTSWIDDKLVSFFLFLWDMGIDVSILYHHLNLGRLMVSIRQLQRFIDFYSPLLYKSYICSVRHQ